MNGKQLRNSILQWAIQGKLVPQDPNDEPASVLLEKIRAEKARLVKEGKLKKDKNESIIYRGGDNSHYEKFLATGVVRCIDDEIPFEIPKGWEWCRIGHISNSYIGLTYKPSDISDKGVIVLRSSNIKNGTLSLTDIVRVATEIPEKLYVENNDILVCARNGSKKLVGKSAIIEGIKEPMTFGAFMAICKTSLYKYVYVYLQSECFFSQLNCVSGTTTINQLTQNNFNSFLIPIPPIEEQSRLIERIDELVPYVGKYEEAQNNLDKLNAEIKGKLKKSILQEGIQGRLVPQIKEEGTAQELLEQIKEEKKRLVKEGRLKKSALSDSVIFKDADNRYYEQIGHVVKNIDGDIPFDIPKSWAWTRIKDIVQINPKNESPDDVESAFIPMDKINAGYGSSYTYDIVKWGTIKRNFVHFTDGDIAFAKITPCFQNRKSVIFDNLPNGIGAGTSELKVLRPYGETLNRSFILYFLKSPYFIDEATFKGTANQQRILSGYLENKLFPMPPVKEQERIVNRIEQLLQLLK